MDTETRGEKIFQLGKKNLRMKTAYCDKIDKKSLNLEMNKKKKTEGLDKMTGEKSSQPKK